MEWLLIARLALHENLYNNEFYIADGGYRNGDNYNIRISDICNYGKVQGQTVRA